MAWLVEEQTQKVRKNPTILLLPNPAPPPHPWTHTSSPWQLRKFLTHGMRLGSAISAALIELTETQSSLYKSSPTDYVRGEYHIYNVEMWRTQVEIVSRQVERRLTCSVWATAWKSFLILTRTSCTRESQLNYQFCGPTTLWDLGGSGGGVWNVNCHFIRLIIWGVNGITFILPPAPIPPTSKS